MNNNFFDDEEELPSQRAEKRFEELVGLDRIKSALYTNALVLLDPNALKEWSKSNYNELIPAVRILLKRTPLFIFAGDVGTGKSTLAESFGQQIAVKQNMRITVLKLSLKSRGNGAVGEMTRILTNAFSEVITRSRNLATGEAAILVIDEADAIAQSRELQQMHHEDRAGVNALIRGIDTVTVEECPVIIVMCTNRLNAIDPAVRRRAAIIFEFSRPNFEECLELLNMALRGCGFVEQELKDIATLFSNTTEGYNYTYSDILNRVIPTAVLEAFPDGKITFDMITNAVTTVSPTAPFKTQ